MARSCAAIAPYDSVAKVVTKLIRANLIIIDDVGLLPVSPEAAEALFAVVDAAYQRRSIAPTPNIHPPDLLAQVIIEDRL